MQKKMKNKIVITAAAVMLILSTSARAFDDINLPTEEMTIIEDIVENPDATVSDAPQKEDEIVEDIPVVSEQKSDIPYKKPISKRKLFKKFFLAMLVVGGAAMLLYFALPIYNRFKDGTPVQVNTPEGETPLISPSDTETAVKTFLEKTRWNR